MIHDMQDQIYLLWDKLAEFSAAEIDGACLYLMRTVSNWIGADNAGWLGTTRLLDGAAAEEDAMLGWRVGAIVTLNPPSAEQVALYRQLLRDQALTPSLPSIATARLAGQFRVHRLRDGFVDFAAFRETPQYRFLHEKQGVDDRLWVGFPVNTDAESFFVFDKCHTETRFTEEDAATAALAMRGLMWFHRQLLCSHGLSVAQSPLTPTERQVVQLLLTEKSEKQVAACLGISPNTVHGHVKEIYRKYGVNGRAGLMAVWLANG